MKSYIAGGLALILCVAAPARAWNNYGHMTIAEIAWQLLTPDDRAKLTTVLQSTPMVDQLLKGNMEPGAEVGEWMFCRAASWPDEVRPSRPGDKIFKDATITQYHHGAWHYVDLPYQVDNAPVVPDKIKPGDKDAGSTLLTAYPQQLAALTDPATSPTNRAVALCWVEHLLGDIHQPLHATTEFSSFYPSGDKGGNSQMVHTPYGSKNLHSLWDELLGAGSDFADPPSMLMLHTIARRLVLDPRNDVSHDDDYQQHKQLPEWANESRRYAIGFVYLNGTLHSSPARFNIPKGQEQDAPNLPTGYMENARAVAELRVNEAGHRLADVLHDAVGKLPANLPIAPPAMPTSAPATAPTTQK